MKKIILNLSLFISFVGFAQSGKTVTFNIYWPDETKSVIIFKDNNGNSSIIADSTIEFNAISKNDGKYLNPSTSDLSCKNDTTTFLSAKQELYLGRGGLCYNTKYIGLDTLLFRNTKNPLLKGKLAYNVLNGSTCTLSVEGQCWQYGGIPQVITFKSYTLNSDKINKPIKEEVITGITETNNTNARLNISPNPFTSSFQIESTQFANFQLTTLTGKVLKTNLPTNQPLDLSDLESGIYIAQFGNGVQYKRIVKQ